MTLSMSGDSLSEEEIMKILLQPANDIEDLKMIHPAYDIFIDWWDEHELLEFNRRCQERKLKEEEKQEKEEREHANNMFYDDSLSFHDILTKKGYLEEVSAKYRVRSHIFKEVALEMQSREERYMAAELANKNTHPAYDVFMEWNTHPAYNVFLEWKLDQEIAEYYQQLEREKEEELKEQEEERREHIKDMFYFDNLSFHDILTKNGYLEEVSTKYRVGKDIVKQEAMRLQSSEEGHTAAAPS